VGRTTDIRFTDWPAGRLARTYAYTVTAFAGNNPMGEPSIAVEIAVRPEMFPWAGEVARRGPADVPSVAISIDDCYDRPNVQAMADILRERAAAATFFCVGLPLSKTPDIFAGLAGDFPIANHTLTHRRITRLPRDELIVEVETATDAIENATGRPMPPIIRPPGGYSGSVTNAVLGELGLMVIKWDTMPADAVTSAHNGEIVLLHPRDGAVAKLPGIIDGLRTRGYQLMTVPEMLSLPDQRSDL
jgi:peptidoglycan/xylan/chitin deacetylase (PgdA/CDA1 family)